MLTYNYQKPTNLQPTIQKRDLHDAIKTMIDQCIQDNFEFESITGLEFFDEHRPVAAEAVIEDEFISPEDVDEIAQEELEEFCSADRIGDLINENYKKRVIKFWKNGKTGPPHLSTIQNRFRKVKDLQQLYKWDKYLKKGGTKHEKLTAISEYVLNKFLINISGNLIIHDINLRMWALQGNKEVQLGNFKASRKWILNFKKVHGIVFRKITKLVSRSYGIDNDEVSATALEFVEEAIPQIQDYGAENTFNADESGFNLEVYSEHTLSEKGIKTIECAAQAVSSTTHSYTILLLISATGQLMSPLFIVLKETEGEFDSRVQQHLFQAANVHVQASFSDKFTTTIFSKWFTEVDLPRTGRRSLLLIDSWTGHCSESLRQYIPDEKDVEILIIPKKTTGLIQPLDMYGFRVWKAFVRNFPNKSCLKIMMLICILEMK